MSSNARNAEPVSTSTSGLRFSALCFSPARPNNNNNNKKTHQWSASWGIGRYSTGLVGQHHIYFVACRHQAPQYTLPAPRTVWKQCSF